MWLIKGKLVCSFITVYLAPVVVAGSCFVGMEDFERIIAYRLIFR